MDAPYIEISAYSLLECLMDYQPMDIFYISFDEPKKEESWMAIKSLIPHAQRVDGIKGFNKAHQECAKLSSTSRFFTIDGDNLLLSSLDDIPLEPSLLEKPYVLSWSAKNSINGLIYGNGGVKNWPRDLVLKMKTHEESAENKSSVDFCFSHDYFQIPHTLSESQIHHSPYQAFRAGFREGVKMGLDKGEKIISESNELIQKFHGSIHISNLERLKIWCCVGNDIENGEWAIYGARLGCYKLYVENFSLESIRDYDWFEQFWNEKIKPKFFNPSFDSSLLKKDNYLLGQALNKNLNLELVELSPEQSKFFKDVYVNRPRSGLMFPTDN